jgi:membrane peptidoglycan carboxypeptidase
LAKEELPNVKFRTTDLNKKAPHYVDYVIKELNNIYADKVEEGQEGYTYLKDKGYTIVTAVDLDTQIMLEDTLRNSIKNDPNFQKNVGSQNGAAVMMDPKTGEIIAMVGSRDFYEESNDPRFSPQANAALYDRSLGSTMKPILYMTAFMNGYNPSSIVPDLPLDLRPAGAGTPYNVNNYDRRTGTFGNFLTMRTALQRSLNIPAVSTGHYFDIKQYEETYKKLSGYDRFKVQGPAAPLGAANMPLLEQVHAYSTLASEGVYRPKKVILEIKDDQNKVILDNRTVESKQVVDKKYTYLINDMNKKYWLFSGFSYSDPLLVKMGQTMDVAGKTGTSDTSESGVGDVAFVAYTPNFVLGMWAGNSCGSTKCPISNNATGENLYKHMYKPFLEKYWTQIKPEKWYTGNNLPEGVRRVELCSLTGKLKSDACAAAGGTIISEFVADTSMPSQEDMIEQVSVTQCPDVEKLARQIDKDLGLATTKTYIRYDNLFKNKFISDQVAVYLTKNGRMPPTEECGVQRNVQGTSITIVSPPVGAVYAPNQDLTVTATVSGDIPIQKVELVDWNGNIVQTYTAAPFNVSYATKAPATPGTYKVTVVATDNNGETKKESSFTVSTSAPTPTVTVSTDQGVDFNGPKNVKLTAALNNYSGTIISGKFNITGTVPAQYGGAVSGNQMTATWMATVKDNYTVEAVFTTSTGVYKDSIKVRVR